MLVEEVDDRYTDHYHPWEEIVHYVSKNQVSKLRRNKSDEIVYRAWTKQALIDYGTIENYLLKEKLHFPSPESSNRPVVLVLPNDFPYSVDPGIDHILIWSQEPLQAEYIESILESRYDRTLYEWVYFVNPPEWQSVRRLPHVHVFIRLVPSHK
ncbi:hypothetical protein BDB01DRAFT_786592 [Pilobolus umbonatus]|nr:hypothetical protein BDB01DRAFT_786592 [Pilobolus umbonatus]